MNKSANSQLDDWESKKMPNRNRKREKKKDAGQQDNEFIKVQ